MITITIEQFAKRVYEEVDEFVKQVNRDHPGDVQQEEDWWDAFHQGHGTD